MVAVKTDGARSNDCNSGQCVHRGHPGRSRLIARTRLLLLAAALGATAAPAFAQKVRITGLSDVNFGTLSNLTSDALRSQSICVFSQSSSGGYNVRAVGSGSGGTFTLVSGGDALAYEVQWSAAPGQSSGQALVANNTFSGLSSSATQQTCNSGPPTSASLIIVLRSNALSSATAGSYTGTLTIVVATE